MNRPINLDEPLPKALTTRLMVAGVPRQLFVDNVIIVGGLVLGARIYVVPLILGITIHYALRKLYEADEWYFEILYRHFFQPDYFDA